MRYLNRQLVLAGLVMLLSVTDEARSQTVGGRSLPLTEEERLEARERLAELGYWLDPENDPQGVQFRHALIAFQKVEGRARTGRLTRAELEAIRLAARPLPRESGERHLEVDLYRQILLVVETGGVASRILPISSGSGDCFTEGGRTRRAITPVGRFKVERRVEGWRRSPLGQLYYPLYFHYGIAIHGNPAVPPQPASHGCIRIPIFAAVELSAQTPAETVVIIYDSNPHPPRPPGPCPPPASQ